MPACASKSKTDAGTPPPPAGAGANADAVGAAAYASAIAAGATVAQAKAAEAAAIAAADAGDTAAEIAAAAQAAASAAGASTAQASAHGASGGPIDGIYTVGGSTVPTTLTITNLTGTKTATFQDNCVIEETLGLTYPSAGTIGVQVLSTSCSSACVASDGCTASTTAQSPSNWNYLISGKTFTIRTPPLTSPEVLISSSPSK